MAKYVGKVAGPSFLVAAVFLVVLLISSPGWSVVSPEDFWWAGVVGALVALGTLVSVRYLLLRSKLVSLVLGVAAGLLGWYVAFGLLTFS